MKSKGWMVVLLVLAVTSMGWAEEDLSALDKTDKEIVVEGNNMFALELYEQLKGEDGNLFFSPYSISTALAMTYAGARGNTEVQMADVLHFDLEQERLHGGFSELMRSINAVGEKGQCQLITANALWGQKGYSFLEGFINLVKVSYGAALSELDFVSATEAARETINKWVEEKTRDKIKDLIKPGVLSELTRLVLTNAIYFKGKWESRFEEEVTRDAPFKLIAGEEVDVPMMNQTADFKYTEDETVQILEMPYIGKELSMVVFLPKEADGIKGLEEVFTIGNIERWLSGLRQQEVVVSFPRFKTTSQFSLGEVLHAMGMTDAFSGSADFSGMTGEKDLFISAVIHKAFVDVNEEGTEAAAATAVVMKLTAVLPEQRKFFGADHPFIFIICDNRSDSILFCGRVMDPRQ